MKLLPSLAFSDDFVLYDTTFAVCGSQGAKGMCGWIFLLGPLVFGFLKVGVHANPDTCPNWVSTVDSNTNADCERLCLDKDSKLHDFCLPVDYGLS